METYGSEKLQGLFNFTQVFNGRSRAARMLANYRFTTSLTKPCVWFVFQFNKPTLVPSLGPKVQWQSILSPGDCQAAFPQPPLSMVLNVISRIKVKVRNRGAQTSSEDGEMGGSCVYLLPSTHTNYN